MRFFFNLNWRERDYFRSDLQVLIDTLLAFSAKHAPFDAFDRCQIGEVSIFDFFSAIAIPGMLEIVSSI